MVAQQKGMKRKLKRNGGGKKLGRKILRIVAQSLYTKGKVKTCVAFTTKEEQLGKAAWESPGVHTEEEGRSEASRHQ